MPDTDQKKLKELNEQLHEIYLKIREIENRTSVACPKCNGSGKIKKHSPYYDYPYPMYPKA